MSSYVHMVAHTRGGFDRVTEWASASWLWGHLRTQFPAALAACLMPDHLHLLIRWWAEARDGLRRVLQHHGRQFGARWDMGPDSPVANRPIARRVARYQALNAYWAGLVTDPLAWPWSTLRDAVGAVGDPWLSPARVGRELAWTPEAMHRFVVSDATCGSAVRRPIHDPPSPGSLVVGLDAVAEACAASLRARPEHLRLRGHAMRPAFVGLARRHGSPRLADLGAACGVSERGVFRLERRVDPATLRAASVCLGDPRLRTWDVG